MKKNILLFLIFSKIVSWAQAPNISYPINTDFYPNDQGYKYATNTAMNPLIPVNIGGPLPNAIYGQVSTVAGIGIAGAIDFLAGLGLLLIKREISTPFLNIDVSYKYFNLEEAKIDIKEVGEKIVKEEIPKELAPLIFAVTGSGKN